MKLNLGMYRNKMVTTNSSGQANGHVGILGISGSGKSVEGCRLICDVAEQGGTVLAFDINGTLADDQIAGKHRSVFERYRHDINKDNEGIHCNLFTPIHYSDGTEENPMDTVDSVTDIFAGALRLGCAQKAELRGSIQFVYDTGDYEKDGIQTLDRALHYAGNKTAERVREKIHGITAHNIFIPGGDLFHENAINVFRLSRYSQEVQQSIAEILLAIIWRQAVIGAFKEKEIFIFVDEFQNMPAGKECNLARMLSEGRKFGINLILATQMLPKTGSSVVMQRLTQCGTLLFFRPAADCTVATARMINPVEQSNWCRLLRTLSVGEFIADGNLLIDGRERDEPLKLSAVEALASTDRSERVNSAHDLVH